MKALLTLLVLSVASITASCDDGDGEQVTDPPDVADLSLTGSWSGRTGTETFEMLLRQLDDESVIGAGSIQRGTGSQGFEVGGLVVGSQVTLTLRTQTGGFNQAQTLINFTGEFSGSGDRVDGTLNGGGFERATLSLSRERTGT